MRQICVGLGFVAIGVAFLVNRLAGDGNDTSGYVGAGWVSCGVLFMVTGARRMRADAENGDDTSDDH